MLHRLARKVPVSDARDKRQVKLNLKVLEGHDFQQLWNRISQKTTYRLEFDDAALVARCAQALRDMPRPGEARVTFELAEMLIGREGVTPEKRSTSQPQRLAATRLEVPDLLGELQNRTELPRNVLADILVQSGRLSDAAVNPSAFVDAVNAIIQAGKRLMMTDAGRLCQWPLALPAIRLWAVHLDGPWALPALRAAQIYGPLRTALKRARKAHCALS